MIIAAIAAFFGLAHVASTMPVNEAASTTVAPASSVSGNFGATSTSDWKTYSNGQTGFGVQYPSDFALVSDLTPSQKKSATSYMGTCSSDFDVTGEVKLCYVGNATSSGFVIAGVNITATSTSEADCEKTQQNNNNQSTNQVVINGTTFYEDMLADAGLSHYLDIDSFRTYHSNACYTIELTLESQVPNSSSWNGLDTNFKAMMEQKLKAILSTFRFIPVTASPSPSGFKTYTNSQYGISVAYPATFNVSETQDAGYFNEMNLFEASISAPADYQKGTDLNVARVDVLVSSSTDECYSLSSSGANLSATKEINGTVFHYDPRQPTADDAMGGQRGQYSLFAAIKNGQCYRVEKLLGYRYPHGFTDPPYPPHFNEQTANADLDAIINSFKFTN